MDKSLAYVHPFLVISSADAQIFAGGQRNILTTRRATQIFIITLENYYTRVNGHCRNYQGFPLLTFHKEGDFEAAEPHFLAAGKRDSARLLAEMFAQWSPSDGSSLGAFALRGVIPYAQAPVLPVYSLGTDICR